MIETETNLVETETNLVETETDLIEKETKKKDKMLKWKARAGFESALTKWFLNCLWDEHVSQFDNIGYWL